MSVIPMNQSGDVSLSSSRLCWVLNRDTLFPYTASFRGEKITIPANMEKIPKLSQNGGNLMPYLEACRFVRDLVEPQGYEMDGNGKPQPIFRKKMLLEQELTKEEYESVHGGKKLNTKKEAQQEERKARGKLTDALSKVHNKTLAVSEDEDE